jgi:hypothetical protein
MSNDQSNKSQDDQTQDEINKSIQNQISELRLGFSEMKTVSQQLQCKYDNKINEIEHWMNQVENLLNSLQLREITDKLKDYEHFMITHECDMYYVKQQLLIVVKCLERLEHENDCLHLYSTMRASEAVSRIMHRLYPQQREQLLYEIGAIPITKSIPQHNNISNNSQQSTYNNSQQQYGSVPSQYNQAQAQYNQVKDKYPTFSQVHPQATQSRNIF